MAAVLRAILFVGVVASDMDISKCPKFVPSEETTLPLSIYFRYLFDRYTIAQETKSEVNLSASDLVNEIRKSIPDSDVTMERVSAKFKTLWGWFTIPNELAQFLESSLNGEEALNAVPLQYRTTGYEEVFRKRIAIWKEYSRFGVENSTKLRGFQTLKMDGILNYLWCMWKRNEKQASHASDKTLTQILDIIYFHFLYKRYAIAQQTKSEVNLSPGDLLNEILHVLPDCDINIQQIALQIEKHWLLFTIPNELARLLRDPLFSTTDALKANMSGYQTANDERVWLNRIVAWKRFSPLGVENSTKFESCQTLNMDGIINYLWSMWKSCEARVFQTVPAKRPFEQQKHATTIEISKTLRRSDLHPKARSRTSIADDTKVSEETDRIAAANALLGMMHQHTT